MRLLNKIPKKNKELAWRVIDGKLAVKDIIRKITDEYDIEAEEAELQVNKFLDSLSKKGLIRI